MKNKFLFFLIILFFLSAHCFKNVEALTREWWVWPNPSAYQDQANDIAEDDDFIYIVGYDRTPGSNDPQWRIEKRRKDSNGSTSPGGWVITENLHGSPSNCSSTISRTDVGKAIVADEGPAGFIYVAGFYHTCDFDPNGYVDSIWRIEKRRKSDGAFASGWPIEFDVVPESNFDQPNSMIADNSYIYTMGTSRTPGIDGYYIRYIDKRRKSDGALQPGWPIEFDTVNPINDAFAIDSLSQDNDYLYVVDWSSWRIIKYSKTGALLIWDKSELISDPSEIIVADNDPNGYIYIGGGDYLEKRRKDSGEIIPGGWAKDNLSFNSYGIGGLAIDGNDIFIAGTLRDPLSGAYSWRIEKRRLSDGEMVDSANSTYGRAVWGVTAEKNDYIYIAGDWEWYIEKWAKAIPNNNPSAINLSADPRDCCFHTGPFGHFAWSFYDPDGDAQGISPAYRIQIDDESSFSSPLVDDSTSNSPSNEFTTQATAGRLDFDKNYYWRVKVWDSEGAESAWAYPPNPDFNNPTSAPGTAFYTGLYWPWPEFSWTPSSDIEVNEEIAFTNTSQYCSGCSYEWNFDDGSPLDNSFEPTHTYTASNTYSVSLKTENMIGSCTISHNINVGAATIPLPKWKEIAPF